MIKTKAIIFRLAKRKEDYLGTKVYSVAILMIIKYIRGERAGVQKPLVYLTHRI